MTIPLKRLLEPLFLLRLVLDWHLVARGVSRHDWRLEQAWRKKMKTKATVGIHM